MTTNRPPAVVAAPPVTPPRFGLFSAALMLPMGPHEAFGTVYEGVPCGPAEVSHAACEDPPDFGTLAVDLTAGRAATFTADGQPAGLFTIDWGDGAVTTHADLTTVTHTYAAAGEFTVVVVDEQGLGYRAAATVTAGPAGSVAAVVGFVKARLDGIPTVEGHPFTAYHLLQCRPVSAIDLVEQARAGLRFGEQRAAERFLARRLVADGVDVYGAPAVTPAEGLSIAEQYAAANYGGTPVLHMSRGVASLLTSNGEVKAESASALVTELGSKVAAGGGYSGLVGPGGTATPEVSWIYVTGQVVVRREEVETVSPLVMSRVPATNDALVLAERAYAISTECIVGAVPVQSPAGQIGSRDVYPGGVG